MYRYTDPTTGRSCTVYPFSDHTRPGDMPGAGTAVYDDGPQVYAAAGAFSLSIPADESGPALTLHGGYAHPAGSVYVTLYGGTFSPAPSNGYTPGLQGACEVINLSSSTSDPADSPHWNARHGAYDTPDEATTARLILASLTDEATAADIDHNAGHYGFLTYSED